jgi:prolipoprotein diacylglyceryl transferase
MYPTLYHFFYDWFGIKILFLRAINSFGFFVAIAFLVCAALFARELRRKYKEGLIPAQKVTITVGKPATVFELLLNGLFGFLIGYKVIYALMHTEVFKDFPHFLASSAGNLLGGIVLGAGLAYWKYYEKKKEQLPQPKLVEKDYLPEDHMGTLLLIAAVFGYLGAKLFAYLEDPGDFIAFISEPFNGLTMYGGLICALLGGYVYFRRKNLPTMHFLDALAPALILAYGIGRIGCHVAGDGDWGIPNHHPNPGLPDWLWSYDYPNNVNKVDTPMTNCIYNDDFCMHLKDPVYPTPLYESIMCFLIFGILWFLRKRIHAMGVMFFTYLTFNGIERFLIEQIRVNETYHFLGMNITQAEIIAFAFILIGMGGIIYFQRKYKKQKLQST